MLKKITRGKKWPLAIILLTAGLILSYNFNKPFWGHHDWNGVYWGQVAKNFAHYGLFATKFGMFLNSGPLNFTEINYNFHFTPFFTLLWAIFFKIFGVANWVSRLFAVSFSLGAIVIFYKIVEKFLNQKIAIISSLFWIATPMFIYYGKMPVHEIPLMFFILGTIYFYLTNRFLLTSIFSVMAMLTTWPGFFLVPAITIYALLTKTFKKRYLILWIIAPLLFGLHLFHNYLVTGDFFGGGLRETFLTRISRVSIIPYIKLLTRWVWTYYFLLTPLSILGFLISKNKILILFFTFAVIYPIVFRDASFRHDYLLIYFWPFLALSSALAIFHFFSGKKAILVCALVMATTILTRYKFILALENSDIYKESVRFGQFIHDNSLPHDRITAVTADPTIPWDGWFIGYYADRIITDKKADKVFYFLPGGKMSIGAEINNSGTK